MIEATIVLSIPILLCWFTTVQKRRLRALLLRHGQELQSLETEWSELRGHVRSRSNAERFYVGKRDALQADIDACRGELDELKQSPRKIAA